MAVSGRAIASLAGNVSSVVTAPEGLPSRPSETTEPSRASRAGLSGDFLLGFVGAVVLTAVVFLAGGGNDLAPNTWVQGGLVLLAALTGAGALIVGGRGRAWGAWALLAFGALAALTYASIGWSVQPHDSWLEANRTLSYVAAFATALLLARIAPGRWRAAIGAVATAATVTCGYGLLAKVFPGTLDPADPVGRLQVPFYYWNAVGLMGAIGLPACLWAGARRERSRVLRALVPPAIVILLSALILSLSRGAVLVAVVGLATWFALAPLRLRSVLVLLVAAPGTAAISAWGVAHRGISADKMSEATRVSAAHGFGVVVLVALVLTALGGVAAQIALDRVVPSASVRRRLGAVLIGLVAIVPVAGVVAIADSSRGLTGEISHLWRSLTNPRGGAPDQAGRLTTLSNTRGNYWRVALRVGEHHPLAGVGAFGFATAQTRYGGSSSPDYVVENAHGYVFQTFADFGAIGLAISLAALITWLLAATRTFELAWHRRRPQLPRPPPGAARSPEFAGLVALLAIVLTFGVHSAIDWTWFIPGDAVIALACAGWVAGRGPLSRPVGRLRRRRALLRSPALVAVIALVALLTVGSLWAIAQPLRSSNAYWAAIDAASNGNATAALADAHSAASEEPVSIDPLFLLSRLESTLHRPALARQALTEAVSRQPANPQTWEQLGCYDLGLGLRALALGELHQALTLVPAQTQIRTDPSGFCDSLER